jgi:Beige/BEACH domain/PH domain associated with Beige/BEACH/Concanavalin A-like lectin/glucanases superfamily
MLQAVVSKPPLVQAYTLQFIKKYLECLNKKKGENKFLNLKECHMIEILFSATFFEVEGVEEDEYRLGNVANKIWNEIWDSLIGNKLNLSWISASLVQSIEVNQSDVPHLIKISKWVQEQFDKDQFNKDNQLIKTCIQEGLLEKIFDIISKLKKQKDNSESLMQLFMMIKFILSLDDLDELKNSGGLMDLLIQENFLYDPYCSDLCMTCIAYLLRFRNDQNYSKFGNLLKSVEDINIKIKLLNSIQDILKNSDTKKQCQESFLHAGTLKTLKEIITDTKATDQELITLWVSVLECVRFMIEDNPACKKHLQDFDFSAVANTIRSDLYSKIRNEIYVKSIESLLYILFETNNIGEPHMRNVKTPEVIPLVIELLSDCDEITNAVEYFKHVSVCLDDGYNAAHFANSRTTDLLLDALERSNSRFLLNFIRDTLPIVICHHITPQELKKIIEIAQRSSKNPEKKLLLYYCLSQAIKNSCCITEHCKFQANHTCLSPTRYFCFRENKSLLKCKVNTTETLLPTKEFSMFMWAYPDSLSKSCILLEFLGANSSRFIVSINNGGVMVEYFQDRMTFVVTSASKLNEKQWNLIGVSMKPQARLTFFASDKPEIEIFVNFDKSGVNVDGIVTRIKENFSSLTIGNSDNALNGYKGRIISFFITKKALSLSHFQEIFYLSFQYNLSFNPDSLSTFEDIQSDKSILKFIFENITFQWHPRGTIPEFASEKIEITDECERFNGVTILEAIAANGGLKIFLPLIKERGDSKLDNEGIIILLDVIADICIAQSVEIILDEDFFDLLIFVLEESVEETNVQLVDAVIKIVGHLEWKPEHQARALKSLFFNKKIWKNLDEESNSHYLGTLSLNIKKHFKCNQETLYSIFDQLNATQKTFSDSFMEIWEKLIPNEIEPENIDGILILIFNMKDLNPKLLSYFLDMFSKKKLKKECYDSIIYSMLYILEHIKDGSIQAGILKVIRKFTEDLCLDIFREKKQPGSLRDEYDFIIPICNSIDKRLERNILCETFDEILYLSKTALTASEKKKSEKFINFLNILTKRLPDCVSKQLLVKKIESEAADLAFALLVYERENFPQWLGSLYAEIPNEMESLATQLFEKCAQTKNFNKLRSFLLSISKENQAPGFIWSLNFYYKIMKILEKQMFVLYNNDKIFLVKFLDFLGVLEDLLNINFAGNYEINLDVYIPILQYILQIGKNMHLVSSTYPGLPYLSFEAQYNLLNEKPAKICAENQIYLREGGFLRLILKFLFIGLNVRQDEKLIELLKDVLKGGSPNLPYLTIEMEQKNLWESRFTGINTEKYTDCYSNFKERKDDVMYSTQFLAQYVIAECTDIIRHDSANPILNFLKDVIADTDAINIIKKTKLEDNDIKWYHKLIESHKLFVHSTSRDRYNSHEKNKYIDFLIQYLDATNLPPDSKNFINEMTEIFIQRYRKEKNENESLLQLLTSQEWITKVHFYLLASTSMKVNFIASCVNDPDLYTGVEFKGNDELYEKINKFVEFKKEAFTKSKSIYEQKLDRTRKIADKKYKTFCKNVDKLRIILSDRVVGKYRIRRTIDGQGRMPFIEKNNQVTEVSVPKGRMSILSINQLSLPRMSKNNQIDVQEEPEISTVANDSDQEECPALYTITDEIERMDCERIKVNQSIYGFIEISQDYLLYVSEAKSKPDDEFYFGSALQFTAVLKKCEKVWEAEDISEVFPRRFTHRHTAFEIYLKTGKSIYINVFSEEYCEKALNLMKSWSIKGVKVIKDSKSVLQKHKKSWQKGLISNLEYLLILNKFASRSFNDISQYPVFPWIFKNYTSPEVRYDDESFYRNLALPIGAQTEEGRNEAKRKFSMFVDEEVVPFHYGSHYSSAGIVLHYLVRIDPFTELAKSLQGGSFDVADRLFYSIESAWESGQGVTGDVKELVPEMFYLSEILINVNDDDFGTRQDNKKVAEVELPNWAKSPIEFIIKHRKALEGPYVSSHLHEWIDLIFGFKQKGVQAENYLNKFCSITYEDSYKSLLQKGMELDTLQGYVEQIVHFGQTPVQLFKSSHPAKELKSKVFDVYERWKINPNSIELEEIRGSGYIVSVFSNYKATYTVKAYKGYLYLTKETSLDSKVPLKLEGARDMKLNEWEEAVQWKYTLNSNANAVLERNNHQYCLWGEDLLVSGFHIDNSFKIHTITGNLFKSVHHHSGLVTCVTSTQDLLFTGSMDTSISSWMFFPQSKERVKPYNIYLGHSEAIRQLAVQGSYQILLSLSINGIVLVHEIRSGQCLRKLCMEKPIRLIDISEHGLIALYVSCTGIKILSINGTEVSFHPLGSVINCMKFNKTGDYLTYGFGPFFRFFDTLEPEKIQETVLDDVKTSKPVYEITTFCISSNKDYFTVISSNLTDSKITTLGKARDKKIMHHP